MCACNGWLCGWAQLRLAGPEEESSRERPEYDYIIIYQLHYPSIRVLVTRYSIVKRSVCGGGNKIPAVVAT